MSADTGAFWSAPPRQRIDWVLDANRFTPAAAAGSLVWGNGSVAGRRVYAAATDATVARGAIGVAEAAGLSELFARARAEAAGVVLLLDSSGARVDEGLGALGAFRHAFREALRTRLAGVPMLAVLGPACFGGASMLATVCSRRCLLSRTRLAASGPAVIEATEDKARFDARNAEQVIALLGGAARARLDASATVVEDRVEAVAAAVRAALTQLDVDAGPWQPHGDHAVLGARLQAAQLRVPAATLSAPLQARLDAVLPKGYTPTLHGDAFVALPAVASGKPAFFGTLGGTPVGAATCWQLADALLQLDAYPASPVVLLLDADGHAATVADEAVLLSAYIVHLSLVIAWVSAQSHRSVLWLPGKASGASYVAFAAAVERVSALPSAQIEILPAAAARRILGDAKPVSPAASLVDAGVADALLDSRLAAYQQLESSSP